MADDSSTSRDVTLLLLQHLHQDDITSSLRCDCSSKGYRTSDILRGNSNLAFAPSSSLVAEAQEVLVIVLIPGGGGGGGGREKRLRGAMI